MVTINCHKCGGEHQATSKRAKYCDPCRTPAEHKNSTANVLARKAEQAAKRELTLAREAAQNRKTAETRIIMPFYSDEEELAWLVKEQAREMNSYHVNKVSLVDWERGDLNLVDNSFEEALDEWLEYV